MDFPILEPGDIVIKYRKKYRGPFKYLLTRLICFFTTEWWDGEPTTKVYHAEMVYLPNQDPNKILDVSQQWPVVKITDFGKFQRKAIFRLRIKPQDFNDRFFDYVSNTIGQKYDFLKFIAMSLLWLFRRNGIGRWLVKTLQLKRRDICSEYVARFYFEKIKRPCSTLRPDYTSPDDILDFCMRHSELYECIFNQED